MAAAMLLSKIHQNAVLALWQMREFPRRATHQS